MSIMLTNLLFFVIVGNMAPFKGKMANKMNLFVESIVLNLTFMMVLYSDFVPNPILRYKFGWIFIAELFVFFVVSFIYSLYPGFAMIKCWLFRKCRKFV